MGRFWQSPVPSSGRTWQSDYDCGSGEYRRKSWLYSRRRQDNNADCTFAVSWIYYQTDYMGSIFFGRRLEENSIMRASCICTINLCLALTVATIILMMQNLDTQWTLLEVFPPLELWECLRNYRGIKCISRIMVILLMYCGRIGSLSFALTFTQNMKLAKITSAGRKRLP